MAKLPTQTKISYDTPALTNDSLQDCGVLNLPRDLSWHNYRNHASTTRSGVPLIYRARFTLYSMTRAGKRPAYNNGSASVDTDVETVTDADFTTLLRVTGCQNNWVMKNAALKFHEAREKVFKDAGVLKRDRGAYSHEVRYAFAAHDETMITPTDSDGADLNGGTWDYSRIYYSGDDTGFVPKLIGQGDDEEQDAFSGADLQIGHSYLMSRAAVQADTNVETEEGPSKFSVLNTILSESSLVTNTIDDDVVTLARGEQDNPPYEILDISSSGDTGHDITEPVLLGQGVTSMTSPVASFVCDIPFGIAKIQSRHSGGTDQNIVDPVFFTVDVLKISEMQG